MELNELVFLGAAAILDVPKGYPLAQDEVQLEIAVITAKKLWKEVLRQERNR